MYCDQCDIFILTEYEERYSGIRGRCPCCGADFPLE